MTEDREGSNGGYCRILSLIEVLFCYGFTEPSNTKGGVDVANAVEIILSEHKA